MPYWQHHLYLSADRNQGNVNNLVNICAIPLLVSASTQSELWPLADFYRNFGKQHYLEYKSVKDQNAIKQLDQMNEEWAKQRHLGTNKDAATQLYEEKKAKLEVEEKLKQEAELKERKEMIVRVCFPYSLYLNLEVKS